MSLIEYVNSHVAGIIPYQPGKPIEEVGRELGLNPDEIIKLASNECPLGPSPRALKAMRQAASQMHLYPDGGAYSLRQKLAKHLKVQQNELIFGNGSNEIIEFIGHCFLRPGTSAVMSTYAFVVYKLISHMFGADAVEIPSAGFTHDLGAMSANIPPNTRVIFVCNPNNPTSTMVGQRQIDAFMRRVPDGILVVFDEAYAEICMNKMPDTLKYVREGRDVIVLRTFSKAYGLAGLRLGYGIAKPEIIQALEKPRQPFNVNAMAQIAGMAALDDRAFVNKCRRLYKKGAEDIMAFCKASNLLFEPPSANFILIRVGNGQKAFLELQKRGVIVRPMNPYLLPEWIRVSLGTEEQNWKFIEALGEVARCL
ncbi:MAG: histidinol-phosphate transaminase [Lentisphaerae bacterium GWF2_52_8]|nr:MAG: histidinol-phosphate transaminase [Lentisphaerae bacterium GWF2_52_8]